MVSPNDWVSSAPGKGSCFHQALHRWALARQHGDIWKVAIGVASNDTDPTPHIHAWLETVGYDRVMAASTGELVMRHSFYSFVGIDRKTVRFVNPRRIMRWRKGVIDKETVTAMLDESGIAWREVNGGVLPA